MHENRWNPRPVGIMDLHDWGYAVCTDSWTVICCLTRLRRRIVCSEDHVTILRQSCLQKGLNMEWIYRSQSCSWTQQCSIQFSTKLYAQRKTKHGRSALMPLLYFQLMTWGKKNLHASGRANQCFLHDCMAEHGGVL